MRDSRYSDHESFCTSVFLRVDRARILSPLTFVTSFLQRCGLWIAAFLLLELFSYTASAGTIHGSVRGKVKNEPIPGANITIQGTRLGASSDQAGVFIIRHVSVGAYTIHVRILGYTEMESKRITVATDTSSVNIDMLLEESILSMGEMVVQARANRELEISGIQSEYDAKNIINVITAQTIERSTDRTAADVLQRVPGISLIRSNGGEGRYVIVRGLEQRYNNTLVDGMKIPSPESKDRFVPLDIFPSALFERIEVTKALTPDLAGDAIGGTTNIIFRRAPEEFVFSASAARGYSSGLYNKKFTTFDAGTVPELDPDRLHNTVNDNDPVAQLGPRYHTSASDFTVKNLKTTDRTAPLDGMYSIVTGNRFLDSRLGIMAAGSYQNTSNLTSSEYYSLGTNVNSNLKPFEATLDQRVTSSRKMRSGATVKADFIIQFDHQLSASFIYLNQTEELVREGLQTTLDGSRGASDLSYSYRTALRTQNVSNYSLSGEHFTSSPVVLRWTANYTDAVQDRPDEADYTLLQNFDQKGNLQPFQGLGQVDHSWRKNTDKQYLGKADISWRLTDDNAHAIQTGGSFQKLQRVNFQNDFKLNPAIVNGRTEAFISLDSVHLVPVGFGGTPVFGFQNYKAQEALWSVYFQYVLNTGALQILAGVRWEQTRDMYWTQAPVTAGRTQDTVMFVDFLPSIHIRYAFSPEHTLRLSVTRTMSRPSYFELVPATDKQDDRQTNGNPDLLAAHSTNVDVRYEYSPSYADQFSIGVYSKRITDPIENQFNASGVVFTTTKANGNPADVYGLEVAAATHYGDLGVSANYTYVFSRMEQLTLVPTLDAYGDPIIPVPNYTRTRALQAQSPSIVNASISYTNKDWGTGVHVSYNYTGKRLMAVSAIDGWDTYEDGIGEMDCSADQDLLPGFKVSLKLINLLNAVAVTEVPSGDRTTHPDLVVQRDFNKLRGSIGITYHF